MSQIETSLNDVKDLLCLTYAQLNSRPVKTIQQGQILALLAPALLLQFLNLIHAEINLLTHHRLDTHTPLNNHDLQPLAVFAHHHGYNPPPPSSKTLSDLPLQYRTTLVYDSLVDLLAVRSATNQQLVFDAHVFTDHADIESATWSYVNETLKSLAQVLEAPKPKVVENESELSDLLDSWVDKVKTSNKFKPKAASKGHAHLLLPIWKKNKFDTEAWLALIDKLHDEYNLRRQVMLMRFNVTIQGFLWSDRARASVDEISNFTARLTAWAEHPRNTLGLTPYHILTANRSLLIPHKISETVKPSVIKKIQVGEVPNRGGVPEGFAVADVVQDVRRANVALQQKDQPKPIGGSQGARQWIGGETGQSSQVTAWKKTAGPMSISNSKKAREHGGTYTGCQLGYEASGRCRFPGGFDPSLDNGSVSTESPGTSPPKGGESNHISSGRKVFHDGRGGRGGWGGRMDDLPASVQWNPNRYN